MQQVTTSQNKQTQNNLMTQSILNLTRNNLPRHIDTVKIIENKQKKLPVSEVEQHKLLYCHTHTRTLTRTHYCYIQLRNQQLTQIQLQLDQKDNEMYQANIQYYNERKVVNRYPMNQELAKSNSIQELILPNAQKLITYEYINIPYN